RQPNIVILLADDLGYGELGCQGNPQIPTPHIDSIAAGGIRCTEGYVTAPNCSPSRAGLLTGRVPTRFGYEFNPIGARNEEPGVGLPTEQMTIAEILHGAGYATALVGKWHQGGTAPYHPLRRGFDEFVGFLHEGHFYVPPPWHGVTTMLRRRTLPGGGAGRWESGNLIYSTHMGHDEPPYDANNPILRGGQPVAETNYLTDALTREATDFVARRRDEPFLLYVAYSAVHSPLQGADAYMRRFAHIPDMQRRIFAAMLANMDDSVGAILGELRAHGLEEDTLVFFLSDNGGPTRELTSSNRPLRGEKGDMYEGGIRVPYLMQWKGRLPAGEVYRKPVSSLDLLPTALAAAGLPAPKDTDGVNLLPFLTGDSDEAPHRILFWRQGQKTALREDQWKLVRQAGGKQKLRWELYDLEQDIGETRDLSGTMPEKVEELERVWQEWNGEMAEPLF
ncbi:MAG: sulfatase-like hydrolase/transferase, partial [Planctomycetota bacterium]